MTNPYQMLAHRTGTPDALELADAITRWHDRMVTHVRRHGVAPAPGCCDDDDMCPAAEAVALWPLARRAFGRAADELTFLGAQAAARAR
jgi:hypothetical protein